MNIHIIGICGTFMGGLAIIARQLGHQVTGSDQSVYPPMSIQLAEQGITLMEGYQAGNIAHNPDLVVVGNAISRGNPEIEAVLNQGLAYTSGPQWLYNHVLKGHWIMAVAGTHGKTTTSSMLAWILECAGCEPGFLIGGVPFNFGQSARLGSGQFFVVEADEYDTAFFDKRSKFVHYQPRTAILNNLEYDHADIFPDLAAIQRQFHHLVRSIPGNGRIMVPADDVAIQEVLQMGCWTPVEYCAEHGQTEAADWHYALLEPDASRIEIMQEGKSRGIIEWSLSGQHNARNALAAIAAAHHAGIQADQAIAALRQFKNVRRRMELRAEINQIKIYDDFAHHPTAIATTLAGLRARIGSERLVALLELRSNTMKMGIHSGALAASLRSADKAYIYQPAGIDWDVQGRLASSAGIRVVSGMEDLIRDVVDDARPGDHIVIMSNGDFAHIHDRIADRLALTPP
ncbi:MAG: UDP-N-acetylmuramate:L-alanyl-gamma-D-glutamyl-meso-diaminopimelate ligase [Methylococcaceae bacterium]